MRAKRFLVGLHAADPCKRDGEWLREGLEMFLRVCQTSDQMSTADSVNGKIAWGYVRGVLDATDWTVFQAQAVESVSTGESKENLYPKLAQTRSLGSGLEPHEYVQLILDYIEAHPDQQGESASEVIATALLGRSSRNRK